MQKILFFCLSIIGTLPYAVFASDNLELSITPIRDNITVSLNGPTTGSVTLYNNSNQVHSFTMSAEDCTTSTNNGTPLCTPLGSHIPNPYSLASWITFDTPGLFSVPAKGKRTITYTISAPPNAIPGGHYGAIFFNSPATSGASISMNRRIGSLVLATVPGEIIVAPEFEGIKIIGGVGGGISSASPSIWDLFSPSQTGTIAEKGKKLLMEFSDPDKIIDFINPFWSAPELSPDTDFKTDIELPVNNKGTIHISPEGKITLHDEKGEQLKNIGKEMIKNENGAIIGEKIVDYLIINEEGGNILPNTNRTFTMSWYGFAHEYITASGSIGISYESPGAYYSRITKENSGYLYPWEKLALTHTKKILKAKVNLSYIDPITKETVKKDSEVPINVEYDEIIKTWNSGLFCFVILLFFIFYIRRKKKGTKKRREPVIPEDTNEEIAALERAQAQIFARAAAKMERSEAKKTAKKTTTKE